MSIYYNPYLVRNDAAGYIKYFGTKGTTIEYNPVKEEWHMRSVVDPTIFAFSKSLFHSLSLGVHTWIVTNDNECQKGNVSLTLSLSSCTMRKTDPNYNYKLQNNKYTNDDIEEFICHDGQCIDLVKRCDGKTDCEVIFLDILLLSHPQIKHDLIKFRRE